MSVTTSNFLVQHNVSVIGESSKPTIVFAHGFGTDQSAWRFVKDAFADKYRLVLFDNAGSGKVDPALYSPLLYNSLHSYVGDLLQICSDLSLRDVTLIGHSVSGMLGLLASIQSPHFFSKLVCLSSSPRYLNDSDSGYIGGFEQADLDQLYDNMQQNYFTWVSGFAPLAMNVPHRPGLGNEFARTLGEIRPDIALSVSRTIFQSDHRKDLSAVQKPVLLIHAHEDIAVPHQVGAYLNASIQESNLLYIDATGHFPHMSAPEEVIQAIGTFL
ncbi:alpha/beta hydrolase [Cytophagaceae bacterium YF14B1]|uniref:Alpha/beta hydrolase n=1 Tax=Xanthocytophaga flava TaxID=3048013 RepID=A0AAE3QIR8_9BACT|nr:alpha/beta hydrolase [Xanthocytophaga flavus]MDJ1479610.1 alpha/beta hydrolase [Xanthocytophaga flavus]